jgi:hypothetical protein
MRRRIPQIVRLVTGLTLVALSIDALRGQGVVRLLAGVEIAAAAAFCLPRIWPIGGVALLAVLGIAFAHHALAGHFAPALLFASLVVTLELVDERQ